MAYRPTILVVDDEENMRESLKDILEEDNYTVELAETGVAALEVINNQQISVVITDARMPEMDGFELLRKVKSDKPDLPVIMITAYATPKLAVEASVPIIPVAHNAGRLWGKGRFLKRPGVINVAIGAAMMTDNKSPRELTLEAEQWIENKISVWANQLDNQ